MFLIPLAIVILFKAELKVLLYLRLKQHKIVKIDPQIPDPVNNFCFVAANGQVKVDGDLTDSVTELTVSNVLRIFRSVQIF